MIQILTRAPPPSPPRPIPPPRSPSSSRHGPPLSPSRGDGYYIKSMNPVVLGEEETRTIKYLNKSHELEDEHSEDLTEKHYEQELLPTRKKHPPRQQVPLLFVDTRPTRSKVVVVETLEHLQQPPRNVPNVPRTKHKKGKSAEVEPGAVTAREEKRGWAVEAEGRGKIVVSHEIVCDFRDRGSISEMKQYNFSKKLGAVKKSKEENPTQPRRKKSKSINEGDIRQIKREIKSMMEASPLQAGLKKKKGKEGSRSSGKSSRSNSNAVFPKPAKHKSHQINTERKVRPSKSKTAQTDLRGIAYTMPITSKMASLYSNTSSLFSSKAELDKVERRHSYVIPTEQSIEEIPEIRQYESLSLRRRPSGDLRKASLINELSEEGQSTTNIISHYLQLLHRHELEFEKQVSSELELSSIPHQNSLKERNDEFNLEVLGSLSLGEVQDRAVMEESEVVHPHSKEIDQQQEELSKLNQIINIIKQKKSAQEVDKHLILQQIKTLIDSHPHPKPETKHPHPSPPLQLPPALPKEQLQPPQANDLSSSELKDSLVMEESSMEGLNLQILDKTLRERESYLVERKERQLERWQQQCVQRDEAWEKERERIEKWMDHQIREVVQTRRQLWKGFSIAKTLLQHGPQEDRQKEMIRCLSDKYLAKSHHKKKQPNTQLSRGRVNQLDAHSDHHSATSSDINIDVAKEEDDESEEQLLNSNSNHLKDEFEEYKKSLPHKVDFEKSNSSESADSFTERKLEQSPLLQPPSIGIPSMGLNLQKIECEMDFEDSLNSSELDALAKESEQAKGASLQLPYTLSVADKEDIFEFIFLDLCIELTDEYPPQSAVMQRVGRFIRTMKEQARKQKGFKTNTNAIRDYLFQFITFLKNKPEQLSEVHLNIDKPLGPTAIDILRYMHVYDDDPEEEGSDTVFIMDIKLFEGFEQSFLAGLQFEKYYEDQEKEKKRRIFLKNAIHIHNKAIFDALNETLDRERPFGVWGEPFSWKKAAKFYHTRDVAAKNSLILRSAQRTIEFGAYMCGFIADKEDSQLRNNPNITQAYIDQIRDDRLSRLLANELDESEEKMLFIDDEETEILVEVAQTILQQLLLEACRELL